MNTYKFIIGQAQFAAGQAVSIPVSRGKLLSRIWLRLVTTGVGFAAGANNTAAALALGDEWAAGTRVELKYGNDLIVACSPYQVWLDSLFTSRPDAYSPMVTPTLGDATTTAPAIDSAIPINFESFDMETPKASLLDTSRADLAEVTLNWTWGAGSTNVSTGSNGTFTNANTTLFVYGEEYIPPRGNYVKTTNPFGYGAPFFVPSLTAVQYDYGASVNGDQRVKLPVGGLLKNILVDTQPNGGGAMTAGLVSQFRFHKDDRPIRDLPETMVREDGYLQSGISNGFERALGTSSSGAIGRRMQSTKFDQRATYFNDFKGDGWWRGLESLYNTDKFEFSPTTTGAARVNLLVRRYLDPRRGVIAA